MPAAAAVPMFWGAVGAGAAAGGTIYGAHKQASASKRASTYQADADRMALEEARLQREEDRRRWEAEQQFQAQQWAASEEDRAFRRSIDERQLRLDDEREARRAPYRAASQAALGRLGDILGIPMSGGNSGGGGGFQAPQAWLSPSRMGQPGYDPRRPQSMGAVLGMR